MHIPTHARRRVVVVSILLLLVAVVFSATAAGRNDSSSAQPGVTPANLVKVKAIAARAAAVPRAIGITTPLKRPTAAQAAELSIGYTAFLKVPVVATNTSGGEAASKALGVEFKKYDMGQTADTTQQAITQAVNDEHDGYWISGGIPVAVWKRQAAVLKARRVPVVSQGDTWPDVGKNLNYYSPAGVGRKAADLFDWALARENGKVVNMLVVPPPESLVVFSGMGPFVKREAAKFCPSCKVYVQTLPLSDMGTKSPTKIVSFLQAHPDVNWVMASLDYPTGLPVALKTAGLDKKVKVVGFVGGATILNYVKRGQMQATLEYDAVGQGWLTVDALVRGMTGQSMKPDQAVELATQIQTRSNLRVDPKTGYWLGVPNTPQKWYALWGCNKAPKCPPYTG